MIPPSAHQPARRDVATRTAWRFPLPAEPRYSNRLAQAEFVWFLDFHDAADAGREQQGTEFRQEPRPSAGLFHIDDRAAVFKGLDNAGVVRGQSRRDSITLGQLRGNLVAVRDRDFLDLVLLDILAELGVGNLLLP